MRQPLSFAAQGVIAALILAVGAALWFAREPVSAAVGGLFASNEEGAETGKRRRGRGSGKQAVPVVVQAVGAGSDDLAFAGIGTAKAIRQVTLYSAVPGEVLNVHTSAGQRVKSGDKIVELDRRQAELAVAMADSKLQNAQRMLSRADQLRKQRVQSSAKVQDAASIADQADVELKTARVALADHTIRAPFNGIVGIAGVGIGDRITPSTALVSLDDRSKLKVEFDVPEQYLPRLEAGMKVDVRTPGFAERTFTGILVGIDSRVHPTKRTVVVRAEVPNDDDLLRPGTSFNVDLKLPGKNYPKIPDLALQFSQRGNYVWLVKGDSCERVPVRIVRRDSNSVLVEGALKTGDRIVVEGVQRLRPGRKVAIADGTTDKPGRARDKGSAKVN